MVPFSFLKRALLISEKYKTWIAGYFEKDGKVYDFLYIQYVGVDDSLGEKLVNNVLNNFTTQD